MRDEGIISISDCHFWPDGRAFPPSGIPCVDIWIYAVESKLWFEAQIQSEQIQYLVRDHLEFVSLNNAWNTYWSLGVKWLGKCRKIELTSRIKGDWKNGEITTRLVNRSAPFSPEP